MTREQLPVEALMRFAVGPDDMLVPDVDGRAEGRGVWVTLSRRMVEMAVKRKIFQRSLKSPVSVADDLAEIGQRRLEERLLGALGLARKAGQLALGASSVSGAARKGEIIGLITASDAAEDGRRKMLGLVRPEDGGEPIAHFELLSSDQLGLALGRENVIHAALTKGAAANSALLRAQRLARYLAAE